MDAKCSELHHMEKLTVYYYVTVARQKIGKQKYIGYLCYFRPRERVFQIFLLLDTKETVSFLSTVGWVIYLERLISPGMYL